MLAVMNTGCKDNIFLKRTHNQYFLFLRSKDDDGHCNEQGVTLADNACRWAGGSAALEERRNGGARR